MGECYCEYGKEGLFKKRQNQKYAVQFKLYALLALLEAKQEVRFQFLKEHINELNIQKARHTLNVSKYGFMSSLKEKENELFKEEIATIFQEHHGGYGAILITTVLNKKGILVKRKRVGKLLHQLGLYAKSSTYK